MSIIAPFFESLKKNERGEYLNWITGYKKYFLLIPLSLFIVWLSRYFGLFDYPGRNYDIGAWEVFFNIFGTVYAVIAGLILVEEFQRHSHLREKLELELNALQDIRDFLDYMDADCKTEEEKSEQLRVKSNIRHALFMYILSLLAFDWPRMKKGKSSLDSDTTSELKTLIMKINTLVIGENNESDKVGLSSMMSLVADITTLRTQRLTLIRKTVPVQLKYLIHLMGGVLVLGIILIGIHNLFLHLLLTFFSSSIILIIFLLFEDLHNPFVGQWRIHSGGFYQFLEKMLLDEGNLSLFKNENRNDYFSLTPNTKYSVQFCSSKDKEEGIKEIIVPDNWEEITIQKTAL